MSFEGCPRVPSPLLSLLKATFLQNQFIKKLICDLIFQLIFELFSANQWLFQGDADSE